MAFLDRPLYLGFPHSPYQEFTMKPITYEHQSQDQRMSLAECLEHAFSENPSIALQRRLEREELSRQGSFRDKCAV